MGVGICRLMAGVRPLTGLPDTPAGRLAGWNIEPAFPSGVMFTLGRIGFSPYTAARAMSSSTSPGVTS